MCSPKHQHCRGRRWFSVEHAQKWWNVKSLLSVHPRSLKLGNILSSPLKSLDPEKQDGVQVNTDQSFQYNPEKGSRDPKRVKNFTEAEGKFSMLNGECESIIKTECFILFVYRGHFPWVAYLLGMLWNAYTTFLKEKKRKKTNCKLWAEKILGLQFTFRQIAVS